MNLLQYTLIGEGTSDACLLRIIEFVLSGIVELANTRVISRFASSSRELAIKVKTSDKILLAHNLLPCDLMFVHRDSDDRSAAMRREEIVAAASGISHCQVVPVVPIQMTEAWLLFDAAAIRRAADNPNGRIRLALPRTKDVEKLSDPKAVLFDLLRTASEKTGRRLAQFNRSESLAGRRARVAELTTTFDPLRDLSAFRQFISDTEAAVRLLASNS